MDLVTLDVTDVPNAALSTEATAEFFGDTNQSRRRRQGRRHCCL